METLVESNLSHRVLKLKERALSFEDAREPGKRAVLVTRAYKETEELPAILRAAKVLEKLLMWDEVKIFEDELIVGYSPRYIFAHTGLWEKLKREHPETRLDRVEANGVGSIDKETLKKILESKPWLKEVLEYWRNRKTVYAPAHALATKEEREAYSVGLLHVGGFLTGHIILDFEKVLKRGFNGIKAEVEAKLEKLDPTNPEDVKKRLFYEAVITVCNGAAQYGSRYAEEARRLAKEEDNPKRREELKHIAEMCERVPCDPARNFWEALQSIFFTQLIHWVLWGLEGGKALSFGRFDQYLYPYYLEDKKNGNITKEQAEELLECFWIKLYMVFDDQHMMTGGIKPDGTDGTNELTFLCLEVSAKLGLQRDLGARIHKDAPRDFLSKVSELIRQGSSIPVLYNDDIIIPALVKDGVALEDARNYAVVGCVELHLPRADVRTMAHTINPAKCLELALNEGKCMITGKQIGPKTGDPREFRTFYELFEAFREQLAYAVKLAVSVNIRNDIMQPQLFPLPFLSTLIDDCLEKGMDITEGGARYNFTSACLAGVASTADAMAAMKKIVFEEKKDSISELIEALRKNFEGYDDLRRMLLNKAPKFGNDEDYVDYIARDIFEAYAYELSKYRNARGGRFRPLIFGVLSTAVYQWAHLTAAMADGRRIDEPLSMSVQPYPGRDLRGPTANFKSVAKLNHFLASGGISHIIELHPSIVGGEKGIEILADVVKGYFNLGGMQVAINMVTPEILREAQKNPELYRHIVVRVFGYSDFFVNLDPELQEYIIKRASGKSF